jgi:cardiolipin synthase
VLVKQLDLAAARHAEERGRHPRLSPPVQRAIRRITETAASHGNQARLLIDGPAVFPAMLARIAEARHRVHIENYIFRADATGQLFAQALAERARAGVEVRIIYDWFGSFSTPTSFWNRLRAAGCQVYPFRPPSPRRPLAFFRRDHRKLLVTDGECAIIGGLCIGDEWTGNDTVPPWRDTAIEFEGPIARQLDHAFALIWRLLHAPAILPLDSDPPVGEGDVVARIIDGPPNHARTYRLYQLITALADRTLYITGAYPLAPTPLRSALAAAARAGVDVRLLAPGRSDLPLVNQAARAHYTSLLRAGVRIYEWAGPMLHAKTLVADGKIAVLGSSNLNTYSFISAYELDVVLEDSVVAAALEYQFLDDLGNAREITLSDWKRRPASQRWRERVGAAALWLPYRLLG